MKSECDAPLLINSFTIFLLGNGKHGFKWESRDFVSIFVLIIRRLIFVRFDAKVIEANLTWPEMRKLSYLVKFDFISILL